MVWGDGMGEEMVLVSEGRGGGGGSEFCLVERKTARMGGRGGGAIGTLPTGGRSQAGWLDSVGGGWRTHSKGDTLLGAGGERAVAKGPSAAGLGCLGPQERSRGGRWDGVGGVSWGVV